MMTKGKKKRKIDLLFITACISTSLVLLLIGIITLLLLTASDLSRKLREEMTVEVVLKDAVSDNEISVLKKSLSQAPYNKECTFISKEDALKEMSASMGVDPSEFLKYNPFYASFTIKLKSDYACSDSLKWIEKQIFSKKGVREINYQQELLDTVNSNIHKISGILLLLAALLSLISFALINNTIKLTVYSQRFVLYSMKLVGAKWSFIRKPFIIRNLWIGFASAVIAELIIYFGLKLGIKYEPALAVIMIPNIIIPVFVIVTSLGILITYLCALSSVNKFLRMKSGELYYI
jgi:cell division transport system permease protein